MNHYEILYKWNLWGEWRPEFGYPRPIAEEICRYLEEPEVISIVGPRRAGKSTVMYQMMQYLEKQGVNKKAILHINFEEPALSPELELALMDQLYETYRERIYPEGKAYIFLDEIQNLPEWERWARARNENHKIKLIITGSSSKLMSQELGTLLTGRHLKFEVYPLNFREQLQFKNIELPQKPWPHQTPAKIAHAFQDYLQWGAMPRVVLSEDPVLRERLLTNYFEDIIYKDVIMRHKIRDVHTLRNMAIFLLTQTGSLISYKRICDLLEASQDLVQNYCQFLQEAFLINLLPFYSLKTGERLRKPLKAHAIDLGIRRVVSFTQPTDDCKLIETMVFRALLDTKQDGIFYWNNTGEVDLLARQGIEITKLVQVVFSGLDQPKTLQREISSLLEAEKIYPKAEKFLVAAKLPDKFPIEIPKEIRVLPLWWVLLNNW